MKHNLFSNEQWQPATIRESLMLDPELPLHAQLDELDEDLFWAEYPNAVNVDIGWYPAHEASGEFVIALNQNPYEYWPFLKRRCRSIADLRQIAKEMANTAMSRPSIRRPLLRESDFQNAIIRANELVFDPLTALEFQLDALKRRLLDARYDKQRRVLTAEWTIENSIRGEFLVEVRRDLRDYPSRSGLDGPDFDEERAAMPVLWTRKCRTIPELEETVREAHAFAKQRDE